MLEIEIFSDAICPWCFIGKRRLEAALSVENDAAKLDAEVRLRWRPYLLYPNMPLMGVDRGELLRRRYGPRGDKSRVPANIVAEAESENIELRYELINRTPNTRAAHRLVEFAYQDQGWQGQHELVESLFQAYFCQGQDVGDETVLIELAVKQGLSAAAAKDVLSDQGKRRGQLEQELDIQLARATELGVSGVPGYVMGGAYLLPGAQSAETMHAIIARAKTKFSSVD